MIPTIMVTSLASFAGYMTWYERNFQNDLVAQALSGNAQAVKIMVKYEKPWKLDKRVVDAAIQGNQYAIQILGIE